MRGIVGMLWVLASCALAQPVATEVFRAGEDGYHTFRIPAIVRTTKGTLLAFAEGRRNSARDWGEIDVVVKRSRDGGRTWSALTTVVRWGADTAGNPAPVVDGRTGTVWLLLTRSPGDVEERRIQPGLSGPTRTVWVMHSRDDGRTWAAPADITAAVKKPEWTWYATGPVNGIQLRSGRLVIPCDHKRSEKEYFAHVIYSDDGGRTWRLGGSMGPACNESTVAELRDGRLMLNARSYAGRNRRAVAYSRDGGLTWGDAALDEALVEPVCQASLLRAGKSVLLFANPASPQRVNLTVRASHDDGRSWSAGRTIHAGPSAYSNLVMVDGKTVGLLYERGENNPYERITFARMALDWLTADAAGLAVPAMLSISASARP